MIKYLFCRLVGHRVTDDDTARIIRLLELHDHGDYPMVCSRCGHRYMTMTVGG